IKKLGKLASTPVIGSPPAPPAGAGDDRLATAASASLSGYRFVECLARLPAGEVWKARDANSRPCLIKLIFGWESTGEAGEGSAVERLRSLRHEALEPFIVIRNDPNRVALILDEHDGTLAERLSRCQAEHLAGIPRDELLRHLRRTAEALDGLYK